MTTTIVRRRPAADVDVIVVGGVPGAGKTTAIEAATAGLAGVTVLDPERLHRSVRSTVPVWVPYRAYRVLVHVAHTALVIWHLLLGPIPGHRLVVHDPGTRRHWRQLFLGLATSRGWRVALVYVDTDRSTARTGQFERGRALRPAAFDRHWDRWQRIRHRLDTTDPAERSEILVERDDAAALLRWLCAGSSPLAARSAGPHWSTARAA